MSVGKSRHYTVNEILPRHFIQTAEMSGVGVPVVRAIFAELITTFEANFERVTKALPKGFPKNLTESIQAAALHRIKLISETN
ncbi:hypothetical protein [Bradyrhizobium quebecense]